MTEGATIGLGMKLNIEGRHFKPNEKVKSYEVQPHVKSFKVGTKRIPIKTRHVLMNASFHFVDSIGKGFLTRNC